MQASRVATRPPPVGDTGPVTPGPVEGTPKIGPNSVLQTVAALCEISGPEAARELSHRAGLPDPWPEGMIPEAWFVRVIDELRGMVPEGTAESVLARSGELTGAYVSANRVPGVFKLLLRVLPARLGLPLLVRAFRRHAWTFAGGGHFESRGPFPGTLVLDDPPTARSAPPAGCACGYYEAAFQSLLTLAVPGVTVRETQCRADGASACHFRITLPNPA